MTISRFCQSSSANISSVVPFPYRRAVSISLWPWAWKTSTILEASPAVWTRAPNVSKGKVRGELGDWEVE